MGMAAQGAVTATETPAAVIDGGWSYASVYNNGAVTVWRGFNASVTTASGTPIAAAAGVTELLPWASGDSPPIYLVTAAGTTADCRLLVIRE